jgi:integrase
MTETKSKPATGTVVKNKRGLWQGIISLPNGRRQRLPAFPPGTSEAMAREKTAHWAAKLREKAEREGVEAASKARTEATRWWEAFHEHREARGKYSVRGMQEAHLDTVSAIADKHPRDWTKADCEAVRDSLDAKIVAGSWTTSDGRRYKFGWKRGWNVWATFTSACKAAAHSKSKEIKVRADNPCSDVLPPERGKRKQKQWLYPVEFEKLMACDDVPAERRRYYAVLSYTYLRPSELAGLLASDVELDVGLIKVTKAWDSDQDEAGDDTKTPAGVRDVPIEPTLLPLLRAIVADLEPSDRLLPSPGHPDRAARTLRDDLQRAGVTRAALFDGTVTTKQVTLYDLRASGITWRTLRRDDPREIQQDAGHEKYSTTEGYVRAARLHRDKVGTPFADLPAELCNLGIVHRKRSPKRFLAEIQCRRRESNPAADANPAENKPDRVPDATATEPLAERNRAKSGWVIKVGDRVIALPRAVAERQLVSYLRTTADAIVEAL